MKFWRIGKIPWHAIMLVIILSSSLLIMNNPALAADSGTATAVSSRFSDVPATEANAKYINFLNNRGIISGYPDGSFHPNEGLSRAQAATIMVKAARLTIVLPVVKTHFQKE